MTSPAQPILVLGATGRHGATGLTVVRALRQRDVPVRVLARTDDERVSSLRALGAEVAIGDLQDRRSLLAALDGVATAYFTYPIAGGVVTAAANFASAGREKGLRRVVVMSMAPAHPQSPSPLGRGQWLAEQVLEWAGFACIHLRIVALFFENLELLHRHDIEGDGVIRNAFADIPMGWMSGEDAGKLGVAALLHPERFEGVAVYPSAEVQLTPAEIADEIGAVLGRALRHETISREAWRDRLVALSARDGRINADMAEHISAVAASIRRSTPLNDLFRKVTGEHPMSLREMLATGRLSFS